MEKWEGSRLQQLVAKAERSEEGRKEFVEHFARLYGDKVRAGGKAGRDLVTQLEEMYIGYTPTNWQLELLSVYRRRFFDMLPAEDRALHLQESAEAARRRREVRQEKSKKPWYMKLLGQ